MTFNRIGRRLSVVTALLTASFALGACGMSHDDDSSGDMGNMSTQEMEGHSTSSGKAVDGLGNGTDLAFVAQMIPHHESAIDMAKVAQERSSRSEIETLAANIISSQQDEIGQLTDLKTELEDGGVEEGSLGLDEAHMGMDMDMDALENADPFDREFIDMMTEHHKGAIAMAKVELNDGTNSHAKEIATGIISAQEKEVADMAEWRKAWFGSGSGGMDG